MIAQIEQNFCKKFTKNGSHLKYCRSNGGIGAGLIAAGSMIVFCVVLFIIMVSSFSDKSILVITTLCGGGIGAAMIVPGIMMDRKRKSGYIAFYSNQNNYSGEEIEMLDREICNPSSLIHIPNSKLDREALNRGIIFTDHWMKFPLPNEMARRIVDIAAVWFDPKPYYQNRLWGSHLFVLDSRGEINFYGMNEKNASEVISEALKRNPKLITAKTFEYQGTAFNCIEQPKEVAELYCTVAGR